MSKYLPRRVLIAEAEAQIERRRHGLKTGFYVKFPDPEHGPAIVKAADAEKLKQTDGYKNWLKAQEKLKNKVAEAAATPETKNVQVSE